MQWAKITVLNQLKDLTPVEEKTKLDKIYNKALEYERYDIIIEMIWRINHHKQPYNIKPISLFYNNVLIYEKTRIEEYKDKATGRYWHYIMWDKIASALELEQIPFRSITQLKKDIIKVNKLPKPLRNSCYACSIVFCSKCKLKCSFPHSPWSCFYWAMKNNDKDTAIKKAREIRDAWKA